MKGITLANRFYWKFFFVFFLCPAPFSLAQTSLFDLSQKELAKTVSELEGANKAALESGWGRLKARWDAATPIDPKAYKGVMATGSCYRMGALEAHFDFDKPFEGYAFFPDSKHMEHKVLPHIRFMEESSGAIILLGMSSILALGGQNREEFLELFGLDDPTTFNSARSQWLGISHFANLLELKRAEPEGTFVIPEITGFFPIARGIFKNLPVFKSLDPEVLSPAYHSKYGPGVLPYKTFESAFARLIQRLHSRISPITLDSARQASSVFRLGWPVKGKSDYDGLEFQNDFPADLLSRTLEFDVTKALDSLGVAGMFPEIRSRYRQTEDEKLMMEYNLRLNYSDQSPLKKWVPQVDFVSFLCELESHRNHFDYYAFPDETTNIPSYQMTYSDGSSSLMHRGYADMVVVLEKGTRLTVNSIPKALTPFHRYRIDNRTIFSIGDY